METGRLQEIILKLTEEGESVSDILPFSLIDSTDHLSKERINAWKGLLSSAASAEQSEEMVIDPVLRAFKDNPLLQRYLKTHMRDEQRHQLHLKDYVKANFNFVKKKKTVTDVLIYKGIFSGVKQISDKRPLPIITAILFYEWFAEEFYAELTAQAEKDKLFNLKNLFERIEKDELRHRAGIKALLALWKKEGKKIDRTDLFLTQFLLGVTRMDVNTASWAFYNKQLKTNLKALGLNTDQIYERSKAYAKKALDELACEVQSSEKV